MPYNYNNFGMDNFAKWALPGMMKKWEFGQEAELLKQKEAISAAVKESEAVNTRAMKGAESGVAPQLQFEPRPGGGLQMSEQSARTFGQLGGEPGMRSYEAIAGQKLQEIKTKQVGDLITQSKTKMESMIAGDNYSTARLDDLQAEMNRVEKSGKPYPEQVRDFKLGEINKIRGLVGRAPITISDLGNMNELKTKMIVEDQQTVIGQYQELINPKTPTEKKVELAGQLSASIPEIRKRAGDPKMFLDMDKGIEETVKNILKPPEKPLRALKTIYGPNGQTQEVEVGANFSPPAGWSLKSPGAEKDMNPVYARIESGINRAAHIEAITKTKQKYGGGIQMGTGPDGAPVITSFGNDDAEKYYTETKGTLLKDKMNRAVKLKQLPVDYKITDTVTPAPEKVEAGKKETPPLSPEKMKAAEVIREQFRAGKLTKEDAAKKLKALGMK